jgi:hypothetical protein
MMAPLSLVASVIARCSGSTEASPARRRKLHPGLEMLEQRVVLSNSYTWTGDGDGIKWSDASNWDNAQGEQSHVAPPAGSAVTFPTDGGVNTYIKIEQDDVSAITIQGIGSEYTFEVDPSTANASLTLDNDATILTPLGGMLTLANNLIVNQEGNLTETGAGTVLFSGDLELGQKSEYSGNFYLPNTAQYGSYLFTIGPNATLVVGNGIVSSVGSLNGSGTVEMGSRATLEIYTPQGESDAFAGTIYGTGTLEMDGAGSLTVGSIAGPGLEINSGTVDVESGSDLQNLIVGSDATFSASGSVSVSGFASFDPESTFAVELYGPPLPGESANLTADGVQIDGATLALAVGPNYQPDPADIFPIISASSGSTVSGTFASVSTTYNGFSTTDNVSYAANYSSDEISLQAELIGTTTTAVLDPSSPSPSVYGDPVKVDATVGVSGGGDETPSGTVTFYDGKPGSGGAPIGSPQTLVDGHASISTTSLSASGSPHSIYAVYSPDSGSDLSGGTSQPVSIVINKALLSVSGVTANNKPYDGTTAATLDLSHATITGMVNGDSIGLASTGYTASFANKDVGTGIPVTVSELLFTGPNATDYAIEPFVLSADITPVALLVTANRQSVTYGGAVPALTFSVSGLVGGDTETSACSGGLATSGASGSDVGNFPITQGTLDSTNYTISFVGATLSITPAPLTITANNLTATAGGPLPTLTVSYSRFVNGDTAASLTTPPSVTTGANASSPAGTYPIVVSGATSPNYSIRFVDGTLTLTASPVTVQSVSIGSMTVQSVAGGRKARGKHRTIPVIVVQFSGPIDAAAAQDLGNYTLATVPRGRKRSKPVAISSAIFSASTATVTLVTRKSLVLSPPLQLTISAGGMGLSEGNVVAILSKSGATIS